MISIKVNKPNSNEQSTPNETSSYNSMASQYNNNVVAFNENLPEESQTNYQCSAPHLLQGIKAKVMSFQL